MSALRSEVIHGDCISEMIRLTNDGLRSNLIFADPPYNIGIDYGTTTDDRRSRADYLNWCRRWISEAFCSLTRNGSFWLLINHEYAADLEIIARDQVGFVVANWITWYESFGVNCKNKFTRSSRRLFHFVKNLDDYTFHRESVTRPSARQEKYNDARANPDGRLWDDVWGVNPEIPRLCGTHKEREKDFPTQLPLRLLMPIVGCASNSGDLVVDLFNGSGTTGVACLALGRHYIGTEINPEYVTKSRERLKRYRSAMEIVTA